MGSAATKHTILGATIAMTAVFLMPAAGADGSSPPGAPWGLVAAPWTEGAPESTSVLLSWQPPADDGGSPVLEYRVYRSTGTEPPVLVGVTVNPGFADDGPPQDQELIEIVSYHVTAVNGFGESPGSATAQSGRLSPDECVDFDDEWPFVTVDPDCIPP